MKLRILLVVVLLVIAAYLRLDHLAERTEFLGDQGVFMSILYTMFHNHSIPLVGLLHSNGIHSGPIYFYLMAIPYYVSGGSPLAISATMAMFGVIAVFVFWYVGSRLLGFRWGFLIAFFYAISPAIIERQRLIWNPSLIPLFSGLALLAVYKIWQERKYYYFILLGFATSLQLQMHLGTMATVVFLWIFSWWTIFQRRTKSIVIWGLAGLAIFIFLWVPYLFYQAGHEWVDIRNFLLYFLSPPVGPHATQLSDGIHLFFELFRKALPGLPSPFLEATSLLLIGTSFFLGGFWARILVLWLVLAFLPILSYRDPIFEHYTYGLAKIPFLLLGFFFSILAQRFPKMLILCLVLLVLFLQVSSLRAPDKPNNDLSRTERVVDEMIRQADGRDFSFTLLTSRSFSDYHYRYFFLTRHITPRVIYDDDYPLLFLVCEKDQCPSWDTLRLQKTISVLCYEQYCQVEYPKKRLAGWVLDREVDVEGGHLLTLRMNAVQ